MSSEQSKLTDPTGPAADIAIIREQRKIIVINSGEAGDEKGKEKRM